MLLPKVWRLWNKYERMNKVCILFLLIYFPPVTPKYTIDTTHWQATYFTTLNFDSDDDWLSDVTANIRHTSISLFATSCLHSIHNFIAYVYTSITCINNSCLTSYLLLFPPAHVSLSLILHLPLSKMSTKILLCHLTTVYICTTCDVISDIGSFT